MSLTIIGKRSILAVWQGTDTPFYGIAIPNLPNVCKSRLEKVSNRKGINKDF